MGVVSRRLRPLADLLYPGDPCLWAILLFPLPPFAPAPCQEFLIHFLMIGEMSSTSQNAGNAMVKTGRRG